MGSILVKKLIEGLESFIGPVGVRDGFMQYYKWKDEYAHACFGHFQTTWGFLFSFLISLREPRFINENRLRPISTKNQEKKREVKLKI